MVASHDATAASHHDVDLRVEGEREIQWAEAQADALVRQGLYP